MKEIVKNVIISVLAIFALMLLIITFSYNKVSLGRVVPKVEKYELSDEMKQEVEQEEESEEKEIVITYELDDTDLNYYEKTKEYDKGKKNPFAAEPTENSNSSSSQEDQSDEETKSSNSETKAKSSSSNFYEDDGTK